MAAVPMNFLPAMAIFLQIIGILSSGKVVSKKRGVKSAPIAKPMAATRGSSSRKLCTGSFDQRQIVFDLFENLQIGNEVNKPKAIHGSSYNPPRRRIIARTTNERSISL